MGQKNVVWNKQKKKRSISMCTYSHLNNFRHEHIDCRGLQLAWQKEKKLVFGCCAKYVCLWKSKRNDHLKTQEKEKAKIKNWKYKWQKGKRKQEGFMKEYKYEEFVCYKF